MNDLQIFDNKELGLKARAIRNPDGSISINAEDAAIGFGWTQEKNGKLYVKWERVNGFCKEIGFSPQVGKDDYIPESLFYRLGMKASNPNAEKFQNWLAMDVIPSVRKTGSYELEGYSPEMKAILMHDKKIVSMENRITNLENNTTLDYGQQQALGDVVNRVVIDCLGGKNSPAYQEIGRKVFAECNRDLKHYFNVNARNNVPKKRFEEAVQYAKDWHPSTNTQIMIRDRNAQMSMC